MTWIVKNLWLIPALPIFAAGIARSPSNSAAASPLPPSPSAPWRCRSCSRSAPSPTRSPTPPSRSVNFNWFQFGDQWLQLGWVLNPLTAVMLVMVTFVGLLIFIYTTGYMAHDENFTRFFCFLALFAGAMLGVIISNSLLLLFMCWEIVGLTSYLLIGFWYHNPAAAAAAKKAFITTRIGDLGFLIGMVWLYAQTRTLLFYNGGAGALEHSALATSSRNHHLRSTVSPRSASSSSAEQPANPDRSRSTSGCPTPWKAPRPSARSSTPPPWSPPASSSSRESIR